MHVSKSTPILKGGYWKGGKPESESSLDTRKIGSGSSFEELIIPNRTRLPSWNQSPRPCADDYQIALNLLRLQSSPSSLAPSSASRPQGRLSHKFSKLRKSTSSPTSLTHHRCSNPSIRIYPLAEISDSSQLEDSSSDLEMEPQEATNRLARGDSDSARSNSEYSANPPTVTHPLLRAKLSGLFRGPSQRMIKPGEDGTHDAQRSDELRGNAIANVSVQNGDHSRVDGTNVQQGSSSEVVSTVSERPGTYAQISRKLSGLLRFLSPSTSSLRESLGNTHVNQGSTETEQSQLAQEALEGPDLVPIVDHGICELSPRDSINSIRPVSENTVVNKSVTTPTTPSPPVDGSQGPTPKFHVLSIADFNGVLGTDAFKFPVAYGPTTLRLSSCLAPLIHEIIYGCKKDAQPNDVFAKRYKKPLVKKYCAQWITELQYPGILWGTESTRVVSGSSKTLVIREFLAKATIAECGAALLKLLGQLPGGILGTVLTFRHLACLIELWKEEDHESEGATPYDRTHKAKAVAFYMLSIHDSDQRDLIISIFSLCSLLSEGRRCNCNKKWTLASAFAPLLLNGEEKEVEVQLSKPKRLAGGGVLRSVKKGYQVVRHPKHFQVRTRATRRFKELSARVRMLGTSNLVRIRRHIRRHILWKKPRGDEMSMSRRILLEHFIVEIISIWRDVNRELKKDIESAVVLDSDSDNESKHD